MWFKKNKIGLALPAAHAALAPARAMTSFLRRHFRQKYQGRFKFARTVFLFDAVLVLIAASLIGLNIFILRHPTAPKAGLSLNLRANDLIAAQPLLLEAVVQSTDERAHDGVELAWHLPPWVEIVRADPPLAPGNRALLGQVAPSLEQRSKLWVNIRALPKTKIDFSFSLSDQTMLWPKVYSGTYQRTIETSALSAEPDIKARSIQLGGSLPIVVKNNSSAIAPAVIVRLIQKTGAPNSHFAQGHAVLIGAMPAGEKRVVFLEVDGQTSSTQANFVWQVEDASWPVNIHELDFNLVKPLNVSIQMPASVSPEDELIGVGYFSAEPCQLRVYHARQILTEGTVAGTYDLSAGQGRIFVPLKAGGTTTAASWSAVPVCGRPGGLTVGARSVGLLSNKLAFKAAARFFAETGDQLGVGPLPPQAGETTSYWIVWSVGPTETDLKNLILQTTLGAGVRATGKFAAPVAGNFSADGAQVIWSVPSLPATGQVPATFAFEIEYNPTPADRGGIGVLIRKSSARALEAESGMVFEATVAAQDTNLIFDTQATGRGRVE